MEHWYSILGSKLTSQEIIGSADTESVKADEFYPCIQPFDRRHLNTRPGTVTKLPVLVLPRMKLYVVKPFLSVSLKIG